MKTLLNSAEYHNKEKSIFVSMLKNLAGTQQQVDSMQPSRAKLSSARSSWGGRYILSLFPLSPSLLSGHVFQEEINFSFF